MKIAVSATGTTLDSQIDPRFGRASYFLVVDSDSGQLIDVLDNRSSQEVSHGAGINAATKVAEAGVKVVLTGRVGPKAFSVLQAAGIKVVSEIDGTVQDAIKNFLAGSRSYSDGPDCDAHTSSPSPKTGWQGRMGRGKGCGGGGGRGRLGN